MKIQFYYVDDKYIDFLKSRELEQRGFTCVPNVIYSNRNKFVYGSVLQVNSINYFVPISSRTGKNPQYNLDIKTDDKDNRIKGSLRFPYMIPVPAVPFGFRIEYHVKKFNQQHRFDVFIDKCEVIY